MGRECLVLISYAKLNPGQGISALNNSYIRKRIGFRSMILLGGMKREPGENPGQYPLL